jgi:hypothetical protein
VEVYFRATCTLLITALLVECHVLVTETDMLNVVMKYTRHCKPNFINLISAANGLWITEAPGRHCFTYILCFVTEVDAVSHFFKRIYCSDKYRTYM